MKKGLIGLIATVALALTCAAPAYAAVPWSGQGTAGDPYKIGTATELKAVAEQVNSTHTLRGSYFKMTADIDLGGQDFTPIGTASFPFSGTFDGGGHSITGLKVTKGAPYQAYDGTRYSYPGLFGVTSEFDSTGFLDESGTVGLYPATIKNLKVSGSVNVSGVPDPGNQHHVGAIVGYANRLTTLDSVESSVDVSGNLYVGGLVGSAKLTGEGSGLVVSNCTMSGSVTGTSTVGGVVGDVANENCDSVSRIAGCKVSGTVTATSGTAAGIVASVRPSDKGFVVSGSIVPGQVTCTGSGTPYGLVGYYMGDVKSLVMANCRYLTDLAGYPSDLGSATISDVSASSDSSMENEFAALKNASVPNPSATPDPDQSQDMTINSTADWDAFVANVNQKGYKYKGKTVKLGADLNIGSKTVGLDGDPSDWSGKYFMGTFDGQNHTITVNVPSGANWSGLFSFVSGSQYGGDNAYATIKDLKLAGTVSTIASARYVGALAGGVGRANIKKVTSSVAVSSKSAIPVASVGGLVGWASSHAVIEDCTVSGNVVAEGAGRVGGIVGSMIYQGPQEPAIKGCEVSGNVKGGSSVGGLIGRCGPVDTAISTVGYRLSLLDCKMNATVAGSSKVGALVGEIAKPDVGNVELVKTGTTVATTALPEVGSFEKNASGGTGTGTGTGTGAGTGSGTGTGTGSGAGTGTGSGDVLSKPDMTQLEASIVDAKVEQAKAQAVGLVAVAESAADVEKGKPYVTSAQLKALSDAIASAESAVSQVNAATPATQEEVAALAQAVTSAKSSLDSATATFKEAYGKQKGAKTDGSATSEQPTPTDPANPAPSDKVSLEAAQVTVGPLAYTGSTLPVSVSVSVGGKGLSEGVDYAVSFQNAQGQAIPAGSVKAAGTYFAVVTAMADSAYAGKAPACKFTVAKASQKVKASNAKTTLTAKSLKKKGATVNAKKLGKVSAKTAITFSGKADKQAKKFSINSKTGKITVKAGLKAGTYKFTASAKAKATGNYKASKAKKFAITIKVK